MAVSNSQHIEIPLYRAIENMHLEWNLKIIEVQRDS